MLDKMKKTVIFPSLNFSKNKEKHNSYNLKYKLKKKYTDSVMDIHLNQLEETLWQTFLLNT